MLGVAINSEFSRCTGFKLSGPTVVFFNHLVHDFRAQLYLRRVGSLLKMYFHNVPRDNRILTVLTYIQESCI